MGRSGIIIKLAIHWAIWMLVFSFSMAYTLCAQEPDKKEVRDTLVKKQSINQSLFHSLDTDIILPSWLRESSIYSPGFLHQSITYLPASLSSQFQQQIDVASPWKQELAKEKELRTLRWVLQVVEEGGTAYLLYEHIRKYGSQY
ncbi:MAG: hypothetical protein ABSA44_11900 [Bacteroidota bacterium]|jgi:hypothetical protein